MNTAVAMSAFWLLFLAEMGDKTQLVAMTLATRHRPWQVALGACAAFLLLNLLAVLLGEVLFRYLPESLVLLVAGVLFLVFAWNAWRSADGDEEAAEASARNAVLSSFLLIFVAELGDKTQLAMIALAASTGEPWSVFTGGTLALWSVSLIGIFLGATVLSRVPRHWMHRAAAVLFAGFGIFAIARVALA